MTKADARSWQTSRLRVGHELGSTELEVLLALIAGLPLRSKVMLHVDVSGDRLTFWLGGTTQALTTLAHGMRGMSSHLRFETNELPALSGERQSFTYLWRGVDGVSLRTGGESADQLLGVLGSVEGARLRLSVELRPMRRRSSAVRSSSRSAATSRSGDVRQLGCVIQLDVATSSKKRARQVASRVASVLRARQGTHGRLVVRESRFGDWLWLRDLVFGEVEPALTVAEVAGLMPLPLGGSKVPGVEVESHLRLPAPLDVATESSSGRRFGVTTSPERRLDVTQSPEDATRHTLITGPSGGGKSWLLANLALDSVAAGHAVVLVDLKGDTAIDAMRRLPSGRIKDVVVYEPALDGAVPALRSFAGSPEMNADVWLSVLKCQFPENFGIRSQRYLRMALTTLSATEPSATIADLPQVFQNPAYRRRLISRLGDPLLLGEWSAFEQLSTAQQLEHIAPALGKISEVIARRSVRAMLAQPTPRITLSQAIAQGKVVIISLPPGVLGAPATTMIGALAMFEIWQAVMARQSLPPEGRRHLAVYVDEPDVLSALPVPLDSLFETARGMNCAITLATQSLHQLPERVRRAALTNAATIATFRPAKADARLLADELTDVSADDLQRLPPYTVALRLGRRGGVSRTTTVRTPRLAEPSQDVDALRSLSRERYGIDPAVVDAELRKRFGVAELVANEDVLPIGEARESS